MEGNGSVPVCPLKHALLLVRRGRTRTQLRVDYPFSLDVRPSFFLPPFSRLWHPVFARQVGALEEPPVRWARQTGEGETVTGRWLSSLRADMAHTVEPPGRGAGGLGPDDGFAERVRPVLTEKGCLGRSQAVWLCGCVGEVGASSMGGPTLFRTEGAPGTRDF